MDLNTLNELKEKAKGLTPDENLDLIAHLMNKVRTASLASAGRRKWSEICGKAPYPLVGEDAQTWVARNRKESDESVEKPGGKKRNVPRT